MSELLLTNVCRWRLVILWRWTWQLQNYNQQDRHSCSSRGISALCPVRHIVKNALTKLVWHAWHTSTLWTTGLQGDWQTVVAVVEVSKSENSTWLIHVSVSSEDKSAIKCCEICTSHSWFLANLTHRKMCLSVSLLHAIKNKCVNCSPEGWNVEDACVWNELQTMCQSTAVNLIDLFCDVTE